MRFKLPRDRTIASTCGLSIGFKKGEFQLVPPAMYADVIAAGGVSEEEFLEDEKPVTPPTEAERQAAIFKAFEAVIARAQRDDFTGGGAPNNAAVTKETGFTVATKEREAAWAKFQAKAEG